MLLTCFWLVAMEMKSLKCFFQDTFFVLWLSQLKPSVVCEKERKKSKGERWKLYKEFVIRINKIKNKEIK